MHIRSFMMGSTVEGPLAKPELHGLIAWFLSQTLLILLIMIPVHAFLQASISIHDGSVLFDLHRPSIFSIGNMISRFHEPGMHPPCKAALAMSLYDSSNLSGASLSISFMAPLSPAAFPFATFSQWIAHSCSVMGMISPAAVVTIPV